METIRENKLKKMKKKRIRKRSTTDKEDFLISISEKLFFEPQIGREENWRSALGNYENYADSESESCKFTLLEIVAKWRFLLHLAIPLFSKTTHSRQLPLHLIPTVAYVDNDWMDVVLGISAHFTHFVRMYENHFELITPIGRVAMCCCCCWSNF